MSRHDRDAVRRGRFGVLIRRMFPERQVHLRTHGRVSHYRLSRHLQITVFLVLLAAVGWASYASVSYVLHDRVVASLSRRRDNAHLGRVSAPVGESGSRSRRPLRT